jgi:hypothetical protein
VKTAIYIFADKETELFRADAFQAAIKYEEQFLQNNKPGKEYSALAGMLQVNTTEYCFWCWHTVAKNGSYTIRVFITTKPFAPVYFDVPGFGEVL